MSLLEKFMNKLGYQKVSQLDPLNPTKPNSYPEGDKIPVKTDERDRLLDPKEQGMTDGGLTGAPEQLSGNPNSPSVNLDGPDAKKPFSGTEVATPFSTDELKNNVMPSNLGGTNEKPLRPFMDVEDVNEISPVLALRMQKAGILRVDKELFMQKYNSMVKEAAYKRIPLSDYIDGKRS